MGGSRVGLVLVGVVLGVCGGDGLAAPHRGFGGTGEPASSVQGAVEGARRRLAREHCVLLVEFADASGRSLRVDLDAVALTPGEYLDYLVFHDAGGPGRCRPSKVPASGASRTASICGERFVKTRREDPRQAEVVLLHEALHTLGLNENTPGSRDITARVLARCGP